jgi:hypothetical protein
MQAGKFAEATKLLPRAFREIYAHPKICEQVTALGSVKVKTMIEFQLARLASLMVTGGNLNDTLVDFIAGELMDMYPTESVADIKLCLERGAMGRYGEIQRMDGVTIGVWMQKYLDEKYEELEKNIEKKRNQNQGNAAPIEGLEEVYMKMRDQSKHDYERKQFEKKELLNEFKRSAPVDMESIKQRDLAYTAPSDNNQ